MSESGSIDVVSSSEAETDRIGAALAGLLQDGDVVALHGELGAGKTRLVRSIVAGLDGADALVNSPTFVIAQRYDVRLTVHHIDAYRLATAEEFLALGGEEILEGDGVCLIEWAERIADVLPADHLAIEVTALAPESRRLRLTARGSRSTAIVDRCRAVLGQ